jgi:hypothetical protein
LTPSDHVNFIRSVFIINLFLIHHHTHNFFLVSIFDQVSIQVSKMSRHPAKLINETSWQIVNGEYDDAIVSLTHTLKTLKLVLSGDAKIFIPSDEMNNEEDEDNDDNGYDQEYQDDDQDDDYSCIDVDDDDENDADTATDADSSSSLPSLRTASRSTRPSLSSSSSSSSGGFKYDFFTSPSASSFLKTAVAVKGRHSTGNTRYYTNNTNVNPHDTQDQDQQQQQQHHKLQVSIFRDPILVRGDHFHSPLDVEVCEQLSYVTIYNLALSHHLKSVQLSQEQEEEQQRQQQQHEFPSSQYATATASSSFSSSRTKRSNENLRRVYLQKALSLYEHSHQILMKQTINVGVPVIHSMALVSNLGQIHHSLGDHHKAEMCMQYLLSTMMYVIDCGKVDTLGNSMDGFFNMILPLIAQDDPAAAA